MHRGTAAAAGARPGSVAREGAGAAATAGRRTAAGATALFTSVTAPVVKAPMPLLRGAEGRTAGEGGTAADVVEGAGVSGATVSFIRTSRRRSSQRRTFLLSLLRILPPRLRQTQQGLLHPASPQVPAALWSGTSPHSPPWRTPRSALRAPVAPTAAEGGAGAGAVLLAAGEAAAERATGNSSQAVRMPPGRIGAAVLARETVVTAL